MTQLSTKIAIITGGSRRSSEEDRPVEEAWLEPGRNRRGH
jgi:hypothetical protein